MTGVAALVCAATLLLVPGAARGARYPLRIDPFIQQGEALTGSEQSGEEFEFGRCVKLAKGAEGKFATSNCTSLASPEKHTFEWMPGPGPKPKFTTVSTKGVHLATHTATGQEATRMACRSESNDGEYTGPKTVGGVVITFTGCEIEGTPCTSPGEEQGHVVTNTLEGVLGMEQRSTLEPTKNKIALDLFPVGKVGPFMEFSCGSTTAVVRGAVLGREKTNTMLSVMKAPNFLTDHGRQRPERFEGLPREVLGCSLDGATAQCGLQLSMVQTNEEKMEINSVF